MKYNKTQNLEHVWSIICSSSVTDTQSNNISLMNVVEKFSLILDADEKKKIEKDGKKIALQFNQELITRFRRVSKAVNSDIPFELALYVITPTGKAIPLGEEQKLVFPKKFSNLRVRNMVASIPFEGKGLYRFVLKFREVGDSEFIEGGFVPIEVDVVDKVAEK